MSEEKRAIQSMVSGRIYVIHKELSKKESELVSSKIKQLEESEKELDRLNKELANMEHQETREALIRTTEINLERLDNQEKTQKVLDELNEMMSSTLHNCFNLTIAEIDKMGMNERQQIFLKLAEASQ